MAIIFEPRERFCLVQFVSGRLTLVFHTVRFSAQLNFDFMSRIIPKRHHSYLPLICIDILHRVWRRFFPHHSTGKPGLQQIASLPSWVCFCVSISEWTQTRPRMIPHCYWPPRHNTVRGTTPALAISRMIKLLGRPSSAVSTLEVVEGKL